MLTYLPGSIESIDASNGEVKFREGVRPTGTIIPIQAQAKKLFIHAEEDITGLLSTEFGIDLHEEKSVQVKANQNHKVFDIQGEFGANQRMITITTVASSGQVIGMQLTELKKSEGNEKGKSTDEYMEMAVSYIQRYLDSSITQVYLNSLSAEWPNLIHMEFLAASDGIPYRGRSYFISIDPSTNQVVRMEGDFHKGEIKPPTLDEDSAKNAIHEFLQQEVIIDAKTGKEMK